MAEKRNILKETFGSQKRWVNWRLETRKDKTTKLPYSVSGELASSTDPSTWSDFDTAFAASKQVGIVFTPEQNLLGIDIDHCLKNRALEHQQAVAIELLLKEAHTYVEVSPSGDGLHLFLKLTAPLKLAANRHAPYEAYTSGRYFTATNDPFGGVMPVRSVSPTEALRLLSLIGYPWKRELTSDLKPIVKSIVNLDDSTILQKMFASKNGAKIQALYDGDTSAQNGDDSAADLALCSHLAFWTGRDADQISSLWLSSPLGSRAKTQKRKDYRDRTIKAAISSCKEVYESRSMKTEQVMRTTSPELDLLFILDSKANKVFIQNTENMCRILRTHPSFAGRFRYDAFRGINEIRDGEEWRQFEDTDAIDIQTKISVIFSSSFAKVGKDMIYDTLMKVFRENTIDSAVDYVKSLSWDGVPRIEIWLSKVYGAPDDAYHRSVASNWLKGLVKRIIVPGCKFDYVLVLEGEQGMRKSSSLAVLGGNWHVETTMSTESKDFFMQMQGKAIVEFSEGETLNRTEVKRMKAIITMQSDKYRPPYGRTSIDFPRRCVFAMTTNQTEYLKDETGNRRWLPVAVEKKADLEWLAANRDQLYAEAYVRAIGKRETTYEFPESETLAAQKQRRVSDPNADLVGSWYWDKLNEAERAKGITIHMVWRDALNGGFPSKPLDRANQMWIADILKDLNLVRRREMKKGFRAMRWYDKDAPIESEFNREQTIDEKFNTL